MASYDVLLLERVPLLVLQLFLLTSVQRPIGRLTALGSLDELGTVRCSDFAVLYVYPIIRTFNVLSNSFVDVYYLAFPGDRIFVKMMVLGIMLFEIVQIILSTRDAFRTLGAGFGDMIELDKVGWLWFSVPIMESLSTFPFLSAY